MQGGKGLPLAKKRGPGLSYLTFNVVEKLGLGPSQSLPLSLVHQKPHGQWTTLCPQSPCPAPQGA